MPFDYDGTIRKCLGPKATHRPTRLEVPPGAWETHAHVIGLPPQYPLVQDRHYTPEAVPPASFIDMLDAVGLSYGLLVQISVHGTDNGLLLEALRAWPGRLKGVAAIDSSTTEAQLRELQEAGVVGVRIVDIVGGGQGLAQLERAAAQCRELGWHLQLSARGENYPGLVARLLALPVPFVIDHMGWCEAAAGLRNPAFQAVLHLARNADCLVKLSGGFRLSAGVPDWADTIPFAQALIEAAAERMVWGSDWPHVGLYDAASMPTVGQLLDLFAQAVPDPVVQRQILVENPARFYGLPGARP